MSTIDNKQIIDEIIANDGYYMDDPRVWKIVEYINMYGGTAYGVTWINEEPNRRERYTMESQYVIKPRVIWNSNSQ